MRFFCSLNSINVLWITFCLAFHPSVNDHCFGAFAKLISNVFPLNLCRIRSDWVFHHPWVTSIHDRSLLPNRRPKEGKKSTPNKKYQNTQNIISNLIAVVSWYSPLFRLCTSSSVCLVCVFVCVLWSFVSCFTALGFQERNTELVFVHRLENAVVAGMDWMCHCQLCTSHIAPSFVIYILYGVVLRRSLLLALQPFLECVIHCFTERCYFASR